ncbi:serine aminopeptidase domain-containing protein [Alkalihalobacterium elongatum]|uniref:serine aminopeptidase domain-containing protein n=1 Tax=Alkalihalobacterium elongatum TaxID=2675466 RepID=UPI001C1F7C5B|nr:alpha/beta hydrolase [Alkalihalobacterium elongatum]
MFSIVRETIGSVPALHVAKAENFHNPLPLVLFEHGYTSAKEHNLHYAYLLAEKGFRVVLPDALHHGEREKNISFEQRELKFWDIVVQSILEIADIKQDLEHRKLIQTEKIALAGTSMGGIVTFGALTHYDWIHAGGSLMGCPNFEELAKTHLTLLKNQSRVSDKSLQNLEEKINFLTKFDLTNQKEKIRNRPLFIWHGERDDVVPYSMTRNFVKDVQHSIAESERNLKFVSDPLADHKVSREGLLTLVDWLESNIIQTGEKAR